MNKQQGINVLYKKYEKEKYKIVEMYEGRDFFMAKIIPIDVEPSDWLGGLTGINMRTEEIISIPTNPIDFSAFEEQHGPFVKIQRF